MQDAYYFCVGGAVGLHQSIARAVGYRCLAGEVPDAIERLLRRYLDERRANENLRQFFAAAQRRTTARVPGGGWIMSRCCVILRRDACRMESKGRRQKGRYEFVSDVSELEGRSCLVVGPARLANRIRSLLLRSQGSSCAPWVTPAVAGWARTGVLEWDAREFEVSDLDAIFLVIAATSSVRVNDLVYREATRRQILCHVVDDPDRSTSVSSGGSSWISSGRNFHGREESGTCAEVATRI